MGTLAGLLSRRGFVVCGSDEHAYPPMSTQLAEWGIQVFEGYQPTNLDRAAEALGGLPDLVIIGNVCRRTNPECQAVEAAGLPYMSMPRAISVLLLQGRHSVVVAGTHGKSTTTALLGHLLAHAGLDPGVLVGALVPDFGGSFRVGEGAHFVIEGDEYDSAYFDKGPKFLHYQPRTAVLTYVEFDHADIFASDQAVDDAFRRFLELLPPEGRLLVCADEPRAFGLARAHAACTLELYGLSPQATLRAADAVFDGEGVEFTLLRGDTPLGPMRSPMAGEHNLHNALAALGVALSLGVPVDTLRQGLASFAGLRKRQEELGEVDGVLVIDDFAHHPTAVRETIRAVLARYPKRPVWAVFEAKSNTSRMRIFQKDYVRAFDGAWHAIIAKPYRKKDNLTPEQRLDVPRLVHELRGRGIDAHLVPEVDDIVARLAEQARPGDVVLAMSGSAFGGLHGKLLDALRGRAGHGEDSDE